MTIHIMNGVDLRNVQPQTILAVMVAEEAFSQRGRDCIITSAYRKGPWRDTLLHGTGCAVDLSVRDLRGVELPKPEVDAVLAQLNLVLGRPGGGQYDVVDERNPGSSPGWSGPHIHIEFDPK